MNEQGRTRSLQTIRTMWKDFETSKPGLAQFLMFFILSNGVTVLQMVLMPIFKAFFSQTELVSISFQIGQIGKNLDGSPYYIFNYASGLISDGGGGGLAYFMAIQITLAIAQVVNFFSQRKVTFKSSGNIWYAAGWYIIAYVGITILAAALQGLYKAPIYDLFINQWSMGQTGETLADVLTMLINCAISFWVYFFILKMIFKDK